LIIKKAEIPMISIVINGGFDALLIIKENLINQIPTLILAGSKGCSDLVAKVLSLPNIEYFFYFIFRFIFNNFKL